MILKLNGAPYELPDGATLSDLASTLKLDRARVVILLNGTVIPPENDGSNCVLQPDDAIMCLAFAGGG